MIKREFFVSYYAKTWSAHDFSRYVMSFPCFFLLLSHVLFYASQRPVLIWNATLPQIIHLPMQCVWTAILCKAMRRFLYDNSVALHVLSLKIMTISKHCRKYHIIFSGKHARTRVLRKAMRTNATFAKGNACKRGVCVRQCEDFCMIILRLCIFYH